MEAHAMLRNYAATPTTLCDGVINPEQQKYENIVVVFPGVWLVHLIDAYSALKS
jgi:hypothetical protein